MLLLALVTTLIGVPALGLVLLVLALVVLGFDMWVNNRRKARSHRQPPRRSRRDDHDDLDFEPPRRAPARRPARPERPTTAQRGGTQRGSAQRDGAQRDGAQRGGTQRAANPPRRNNGANGASGAGQGGRPQQRPAGGRPGARR
ncbi:hypothetical protein [Saccharopolyspora sp. 5N708]|uniref:hypothetical protein n=1 Tax=Saccharopolyspora sp. 5N708 TaxID=3457424 RepID=UPI003FD00041